jgi:hypothetical protein
VAPSLLSGLIFDSDGARLSPTHAVKEEQAISILCLDGAYHAQSLLLRELMMIEHVTSMRLLVAAVAGK